MIVVVSTHFDDAVFSCWTLLESADDVEVVTVFTSGPDDDRITEWDADAGVTSAVRMTQRAAENDAALRRAGCRAVDLGLREGQYDGGVVDPLALREPLGRADVVYIPAGSGLKYANAEHAVVRHACLSVRPDARFYADNPYWQFRADARLPAGLEVKLERVVIELTPAQRARKAEAIACYAGELAKLERAFGALTDPSLLEHEVRWH